MNRLLGTFMAFLITLGLKHNTQLRKMIHVLICVTIMLISYNFIWISQFSSSFYTTAFYIMITMIWTFYIRYPLFRTYSHIFDIQQNPELSAFRQAKSRLILKPFDAKWKIQFEKEKTRTNIVLLDKWKHIFDNTLTPNGIIHIGSTSIKDIALAKPQHDCALAITCQNLPNQLKEDLAQLRYSYIGVAPHSLDCADHFFFFMPNEHEKQDLGEGFFLHVVTPKVHEWLRTSVYFCQYLSENKDARERYTNLKRQISMQETNMGPYTMKKYELAMELRKEAKIWMKMKND